MSYLLEGKGVTPRKIKYRGLVGSDDVAFQLSDF